MHEDTIEVAAYRVQHVRRGRGRGLHCGELSFRVPETTLVERVKAAGSLVISSATTVKEARWLENHGADAIIAQGAEAGGHRGMFLTSEVASQVGTLALVLKRRRPARSGASEIQRIAEIAPRWPDMNT